MAGTSLLVLLDDIVAVLDDVALMTKVAAKKTVGVLGDDLAVNAEKVTGVRAERELPVVWAVAKGSMGNKCILVPAALFISFVAPWLVTPVLMLGGLFLCYEGFEKVAHAVTDTRQADQAHQQDLAEHLADPAFDLVAFERRKIRGAVRTDLILSAEIIVLTLGIVAESAFTTQVLVVSAIALSMTVGVYGLVAAIVKLDDAGLYLLQRRTAGIFGKVVRRIGAGLLLFAPWLMKLLVVVGTAAMFLVGGGILVHGTPPLEHAIEALTRAVEVLPRFGAIASPLAAPLAAAVVGLAAGAAALGLVSFWHRLRR